jgi:predicted amidohydrolase YtcJ
MIADLVLRNGKVVTLDAEESIEESVAVKFGRILAVGSDDEVIDLVGPNTEVVDLKGRTLIPGLIESHCHPTSAEGIQRVMGVIDGSFEAGIRSIEDIKARIAQEADRTPEGEWINVAKEDESKLVEGRHPIKWELDEVAPHHPVMVTTVGGHLSIVNSKALENAGITRDSPDPKVGDDAWDGTKLGRDGRFEKDPVTGDLTGRIYEGAMQLIQPIKFGREASVEENMEGIKWMLEQYAAAGLTCAVDGGISKANTIRALQELRNRDQLPIRMRMDIRYELMEHFIELGIIQGFGDDMLKLTGLKITADGAVSARTAWVAEPYLHRPNYCGDPAITREKLTKVMMEGCKNGYRFHCHSNGEKAIQLFLDVLEEVNGKYPRKDPRDRIIHCTVVTPEIVSRIKELQALPTIFGSYPYYHGDKLIPAFGEKRLERMFPARWFLDAEIKVAAHSDHSASPYPPIMGIHSLVNRKTSSGLPAGESQRISVMEALKLYTINAAYHSYDEDKLGSIEEGKLADMVVLGEDILTIPPEEIIDTPIDMTIIDGKIVFKREA